MPCNGTSLGCNGGALRARNILPWGSRGIELGGEGEREEIVVPRSGRVPIRVVRVCFTAEHEKDVVDDSDCLSPSERVDNENATERQKSAEPTLLEGNKQPRGKRREKRERERRVIA